MDGGGDLYMSGIDKNKISEFIPGKLQGLAFWVKAEKENCVFKPVDEYVKTVSPTIGENILKQYGNNPKQPVIVAINNLVKVETESASTQQNSLVRLEVDTQGRTRFPVFVSTPEKLDVISIQDMIDPTNPSQRNEKLCTKLELNLSSDNMTIYSISTNINISYNENLKMIILSVLDPAAPATEFSEIIIFSRKLSAEENELMEGYLAYKKNDQYFLKLGHTYLPIIQSIPFMKTVSSELMDIELNIKKHMEDFDTAVSTYKSRLPTAEILEKAPLLKDKSNSALLQLSTISQNLVKGALLARKQKMETLTATFDAIQKLSLYAEPLTVELLDSKLTEFKGIMSDLDAYMKTLENVDTDVEAAVQQNKNNEQIKKRNDAISAELLKEEKYSEEAKKEYIRLIEKQNRLNSLGKNSYDMMYTEFTKKMMSLRQNIDYYHSSVSSKWNTMLVNYKDLDKLITSGEWLTYDPSLNSENTVTKRDTVVFNTKYTDPYYKSIQDLYEVVRNQVVEGDLVYLYNEVEYIMAMYKTFLKKLNNKEIIPTSKSMFFCLFKNRLKDITLYEKEFTKLYTVISEAISDLLSILSLNKKYKSSQMKLEKTYPIPVTYTYLDVSKYVSYIRKVNKHDNSLSMIEYIVCNKDGTIQYMDEESLEVDFVFPSLENIYKNKEDNFYVKKLPYCDDSGVAFIKKYIILKPYSKTESILDSISKNQVIPKYYHLVDGLFEIPRDSENGIYEMKIESPQTPIILPKYAMADGKYFICVNVGDIPLNIKIPGFEEDSYDLIGPDEVCMYIYTGERSSTTTFYGRVPWSKVRLAYDTIYDTPRSSLCCKLTDLSIYIFMNTEKQPLFNRNGYLVEAEPDENSYVYNIDDIYKACPYQVKIGKDMKVSDLEINSDWGEQEIPVKIPEKIHIVEELSTHLPVFCNSNGIPAIDEFGYTKYVKSPLFQIKDTIITRSYKKENIEVILNPSVKLVQYGLMPKEEDIFPKVYRSNFVKQYVKAGTDKDATDIMFCFVNSIGYPLVSPSNNYIQVENLVFEPPYYVKYTENFITEYAFIPEEGTLFVPNKTVLEIKPFPRIFMKTSEEKETAEIEYAIKTISYRYITGGAYIQYTITQLQTMLGFCQSVQQQFSGISETIELLNNYVVDIIKLQSNYKSYETAISAIKGRMLILDKSNDEKMAMNTFDMKMKDTLNKVYKLYTEGKTPVVFFKCIIKKIEKIRKQIAELKDTKLIEIHKSITNIQTIVQNNSIEQGGTKNVKLVGLLNSCTKKKVEFDGILKALQENLNNIPKDLNELETWVDDQKKLIEHANDLYREILEMDTVHTVNIFTQKIMNDMESIKNKLKENDEKIKALIEYKKKMAFWLDVYIDYREQHAYNDGIPIPVKSSPLKGYAIKLLPFEELENPLAKRDWYSLVETDILEKSTRMRILLKLVEPMKAFIEKYKDYYTKYDISLNAPDISKIKITDEKTLKKILEDSDKTTNEHIAAAIEIEANLEPIFKEYKDIKIDLYEEIKAWLNKNAKEIHDKWLDCSGKKTAIQTNITLLQPHLNESQTSEINKIVADLENLFSSDKLSGIDDIQRSLKTPDYYKNDSYIMMILLNTNRKYISSVINNIHQNLVSIQSNMEKIQAEILSTMKETNSRDIDGIHTEYNRIKGEISDGAKLKEFLVVMDPKIAKIVEKSSADIPSSISLFKAISELKTELKTYSP